MSHSSDGSAGAVDLCEPLRVTWTSHSLVADFQGSPAGMSVSKGRKQKLPSH